MVMEPKNKSPPHKPLLPSNTVGRDIASEWRQMFSSLRAQGWKQTEAIDQIRSAYQDPSRACVEYHLFPERKRKQSSYPSKKWGNLTPEQRVKYSAHKAEYRRVVRHLDEALENAFKLAAPRTTLPLEEIVTYVQKATGVYIRPPTILRASELSAQRRGYPLVSPLPDTEPLLYRLASGLYSDS